MKIYTEKDLGREISNAELKEHLLDMLKALDGFCRENGLKYYLSGGTLLGAVRHKGFIPWDDDVDVKMSRPDCEKLMELSGGKIGNYVLMEPTAARTYSALYYRMYDETVLMKRSTSSHTVPAFLDIFPIDGLPDDERENRRHYRRFLFWRRLSDSMKGTKAFHGKNLRSKLAHGLLRPIAKLWGREKVFEKMMAIMCSIPFGSTGSVTVMASRNYHPSKKISIDKYKNTVELPFEDTMLMASADYEIFLIMAYGDYMTPPPPDKRYSKHAYIPHLTRTEE